MSETTGQENPQAPPEASRGQEIRDSRETVLTAFSSAYSLLEKTPDDQLTLEEKWTKQAISAAKKETLDKDRNTFINSFENHETGEKFSQREGIPIDDDFLDFIQKQTDFLPQDSLERRELASHLQVLRRNRKSFYKFPHRMEPSRLLGRVHQEANLIANDSRATGSMDEDWYKGEETLMKRFELDIPAREKTITPTEESNQDEPVPVQGTDGESEEEQSEKPILTEDDAPPAVDTQDNEDVPEETEPIPEPTPEPLPPPQPAPIEQIRREISILNRTVDVRKRSQDLAEEQLRNEMRRGSGWNPLNWPRKIGLRIMEEYHRQKFIARATKAMIENNNSYLTMDVVKNAAINATNQATEEKAAGKAKIEQIQTGEVIQGEQIEQAQGALREAILNDILRPIVEGQITNESQIQERLRAFVQTHENDPQVQAIFGRNATQYKRLAEYFASDLLETGELIKQDISAHRYALSALDEVVQIKLANTRWAAETEPTFNAVDKAIAWAEQHKLTGVLINPATIGATFSLATFGLMKASGASAKALQVAVPIAGLLPGALFAAARRNYDLKVDMTAHRRERAYSKQIPQDAKRREALEKFAYSTTSVKELLAGGGTELTTGTQREALSKLLKEDLRNGQATNRANVIRRIAEIKSRLDFSSQEKVDLVTFERKEQVEQGRLALVKAVVEARLALRNTGMADAEIGQLETNFQGEWNQKFTQNKEQQDRSFKNYRLKQALVAGAIGGATGLAGGIVSQEVLAGIGRYVPGTHELPVVGALFGKGQTAAEKVVHEAAVHLGHPEVLRPSPDLNNFQELFQQGGDIEVGDKFKLSVDPSSHSVTIIDSATGLPHPITPAITIDQAGHLHGTGIIPKEIQDELAKNNFVIKTSHPLPAVPRVETPRVSNPVTQWEKLGSAIDHREWYSYNLPGSQANDLQLHTFKNNDSVILDMSKMKLGYQNGLKPNPIDVGEIIRNKQAGFAFSLPGHAGKPVWVPDGADGVWDGKLTLNPNDTAHVINLSDGKTITLGEFSKMVLNQNALKPLPNGDIATELLNHRDIFKLGLNGKMGHIEAGRIVDVPQGKVLQAFATILGKQEAEIPPLPPPPPPPTPKPPFEIIPPIHQEQPPIIPIPFAPRYPLEQSINPTPQEPTPVVAPLPPNQPTSTEANVNAAPEDLAITPEELSETERWANQYTHGYVALYNKSNEEKRRILEVFARRVKAEEQELEDLYSETLNPLSPIGQEGIYWQKQSNPGMLSCQFASAGNALRSLEVYDSNRHTEQSFINTLGGNEYVKTHPGGAGTFDLGHALENLAPAGIEITRTNSVSEILQEVEQGAAAIVELGPHHVGTIPPGNRVIRDSTGKLTVQVIDPLTGPRFVPIETLTRSDILLTDIPNASPGIIFKKVSPPAPAPVTTPEAIATTATDVENVASSLHALESFPKRTTVEDRRVYERSLDKVMEQLKKNDGIVELERSVPTIIIPDLHGRRDFMAEVMNHEIGDVKVYSLLRQGKINVVCVGDGMHTEIPNNWISPQHRLANGMIEFTEYKKMMEKEMTASLGLMKMVMDLKNQFPESFHYLRGNHDDILGGFYKFANESEQVRAWIKGNFGEDFLQKWAKFEDMLPYVAKGESLVVSHTVPDRAYTAQQIKNKGVDVKNSFTWTDNTNMNDAELQNPVQQTLANLGMPATAQWVIGHRHTSGDYGTQLGGQLIQVNDDKEHIITIAPSNRPINPTTDVVQIG